MRGTGKLVLAMVVVLALALAACAPAAAPSALKALPPIKIPIFAVMTGPAASSGAFVKLGAQVAQEDINRGGGINGHPLELVFEDDAFDPQQTVSLIRKFVERDKAFAFLGPLSGKTNNVAYPVANELKIPQFSYAIINPGSPPTLPWVFRMGPSDEEMAPALTQGFKKVYPQVKKVVIMGDMTEMSTELWVNKIFPQFLPQAGYEVIATVGYPSGTTDWAAIVTKVKDLKPEGIALSAGAAANPSGTAKELARQGVKVPVMAAYQFMSGYSQMAGPDVEGWIVGWPFDPNRPEARDFVSRLEALAAGIPTLPKPYQPFMEASVYDTTMILARAMREAKITPDMDPVRARTAIADALRNIKEHKGIVGNVSIDAQDAKWTVIRATIVRDSLRRSLD